MWTRASWRAACRRLRCSFSCSSPWAPALSAASPGTGPHLFSVPSDGPAAAALARTQARVVARYAAFTLVEAEGDDATRLRRAGADQRDDMREVRLGRSVLDPLRERAPLAHEAARPAGPRARGRSVRGSDQGRLARSAAGTGVRVVTYMAENGYLVRGSAEELAAVGALVGADAAVRAVVPFTAADKLGAGREERGSPAARRSVALGRRRLARARSRVDDAGPGASRDVRGRAVPDAVRRARRRRGGRARARPGRRSRSSPPPSREL